MRLREISFNKELNKNVPKYPKYPEKRKPQKRTLSTSSEKDITKWLSETGIKIVELEPENFSRLTRLLHTYQELNSTGIEELSFTDLYVHRVRLKEGTNPFSKIIQRRWPPGKEFWMRRIISDGLKYGLYESTIKANGKLSNWNATVQLVDKSDCQISGLTSWEKVLINIDVELIDYGKVSEED